MFTARAADVNLVQSAVATVVVILAVGNFASYAEIDVFHKLPSDFILSGKIANYTATVDKA